MNTGCSTLNDSIKLGSIIGGIAGAGATYTVHRSAGQSPAIGTVTLGAGIGTAIGMLTAYFVHKQVEEDKAACDAAAIDGSEFHLLPHANGEDVYSIAR